MMHYKNYSVILLLVVGGLLAGCNGSSSSGSDNNDTATISGLVYAAPVSGAQVNVKTADGEVVAGPVQSDSNGNYTIKLDKARLGEALIIESTGGSFIDEATGLSVASAGNLMAYVAGGKLTSGSSVSLTPDTTIVGQLIAHHQKTPQEAKSVFETAFGYIPDSSITPVSSDGEEIQLRAALRAGAFSQLNMDLGLEAAEQFELLQAIAKDLADGAADGSGVDGPVNIGSSDKLLPEDMQNRFARAMTGFFANPNNTTGLTADKIGNLPEGNIALTDSYEIKYASIMGPMEGKSTCTLTITNKADGGPATGLDILLKPKMYMATYSHSTPVGDCTETDEQGTYQCTVYYLMASKMMNGMPRGFWDMKIILGGMNGEEAHFYPSVMMAMGGDTAKAVLRGQTDKIAGMGGMSQDGDMAGDHQMQMSAMDMGDGTDPESRQYFLFKDSITGMTGNHTFNLFIATKESMMSYPVVSIGTVLKNETGAEWIVDTMSVEVSTDQTNWIDATDKGNGHWSAAGISGLTDSARGTLYVKLIVNGEQKTDDGKAPDGMADNAMFIVTPSGSSTGMGM